MSKIFFENKKKNTLLINKLSYPETINERIVNAIASGVLEGFIPVARKQKRKETRLECNTTGMISLNTYFQGIVSRKMFLNVVDCLIKKIKLCERNMINPNNLDFQKDRIFVDAQTKELSCVYWPIVNNQMEHQPHLFLKEIPYDITFNQHEDTSYIKTYTDFFAGLNPFSINSFDKMIQKLLGNSTQPIHSPSEQISDDKNAKKNYTGNQANGQIEYDPFSGTKGTQTGIGHESEKNIRTESKICNTCGTENMGEANFCTHCGKEFDEVPSKQVGGTTVLGCDTFGGTTVLGSSELDEPTYPYLIRKKNEEKISVNKPSFRIGKEKAYSDYFVSDNSAVSRSHADIITRDRRYYIIDLNSTNKTYIDGRAIPVENEVEIFSGTELRLANEDFTFYIEN